jgi:hypothetical protein
MSTAVATRAAKRAATAAPETDDAKTATAKAARLAKDATVVKEPAAKRGAASTIVEIERLQTEIMYVPIVGTSPLMVHRFSEKAKRQMLDAMQGVKKVKEHKDPKAEFEGAFYRFADGRYGFPAIGFKDCMVSAGRFYSGVTMVLLRQVLFVNGELGVDNQALIEIEGDADEVPIMREDVVRVGINGTDLRYRPQFTNWRATLKVRYIKSQLSQASVLSLLDAGGMGVGVGEWRPEKGGDMGTFTIDENRELVVVDNSRK